MIACVDTYYMELQGSRTGLVLFENWNDSIAVQEFVDERLQEPAKYIPGKFFERELPLILAATEPFIGIINSLIVDGYVWLDAHSRKGLGALLYEEFNESISVIGVAKNRFFGSTGRELFRGVSCKPLIVTAAGLDENEAAHLIQTMHGQYRIPTLIKRADYLSRHGIKAAD